MHKRPGLSRRLPNKWQVNCVGVCGGIHTCEKECSCFICGEMKAKNRSDTDVLYRCELNSHLYNTSVSLLTCVVLHQLSSKTIFRLRAVDAARCAHVTCATLPVPPPPHLSPATASMAGRSCHPSMRSRQDIACTHRTWRSCHPSMRSRHHSRRIGHYQRQARQIVAMRWPRASGYQPECLESRPWMRTCRCTALQDLFNPRAMLWSVVQITQHFFR